MFVVKPRRLSSFDHFQIMLDSLCSDKGLVLCRANDSFFLLFVFCFFLCFKVSFLFLFAWPVEYLLYNNNHSLASNFVSKQPELSL